jgi:hypothetical protein
MRSTFVTSVTFGRRTGAGDLHAARFWLEFQVVTRLWVGGLRNSFGNFGNEGVVFNERGERLGSADAKPHECHPVVQFSIMVASPRMTSFTTM